MDSAVSDNAVRIAKSDSDAARSRESRPPASIKILAGLKICFLAGTLGQGGAERQLFYILRALKQAGADPHVLTLTNGEFWTEPICQLGINVTWVGQSRFRLFRLLRILRKLRRLKTQIVQSQHFYANLYATIAGRALGMREIGAIRNNVTSEMGQTSLGTFSLKAPRLLAPNSKAALAIATRLRAQPSACYFLPNVVDTRRFTPGEPHAHDEFRLLIIGRLVPQKKTERFLNLLARLKSKASLKVFGTVIGEGPLRQPLEQQSRELGLDSDTVRFCPSITDLPEIYRQSDLFVLTSDWEGTPNVLLESMACALPVVTTGVGGIPEIVQDGVSGYIVQPEDSRAMYDAVLRLAKDAQLRRTMGRAGRAFVEANHSTERLPEYLAGLYQLALK